MEGERGLAQQVPARLTPKERLRFGLGVGSVFLLLAALSRWRGHAVAPVLLGTIGALLVLAGIIIPARLDPVYRAWMGLARAISRVTTPIIMGLLYFIVLTPIGLARRLFGGNPLKAKANDGSYWVRHTSSSGHSMTRQY